MDCLAAHSPSCKHITYMTTQEPLVVSNSWSQTASAFSWSVSIGALIYAKRVSSSGSAAAGSASRVVVVRHQLKSLAGQSRLSLAEYPCRHV